MRDVFNRFIGSGNLRLGRNSKTSCFIETSALFANLCKTCELLTRNQTGQDNFC